MGKINPPYPRVSVIVPVYNAERYLGSCLDSLLSQNLTDIEIIVVDDGSLDRSGNIAACYASADSRIKVIHQSNHGQGFARDVGMHEASGDYIGFVDSDDWVEKDMFRELLAIAECSQSDMVYSGFRIMRQGAEVRKVIHPLAGKVIATDSELFRFRARLFGGAPGDARCDETPVSVWCCLYRKAFLYECGVLFGRACHYEDGFFNIRVSKSAARIAFSDGVFYNYRKDNQLSTTSEMNERSIFECQDMFRELLELADEEVSLERVTECELRAARTIMSTCRSLLFKIEKAKMPTSQKTALAELILNDASLNKALKNYPVYRLPLWEAIAAYAMKHKLKVILFALAKLRNAVKKW